MADPYRRSTLSSGAGSEPGYPTITWDAGGQPAARARSNSISSVGGLTAVAANVEDWLASSHQDMFIPGGRTRGHLRGGPAAGGPAPSVASLSSAALAAAAAQLDDDDEAEYPSEHIHRMQVGPGAAQQWQQQQQRQQEQYQHQDHQPQQPLKQQQQQQQPFSRGPGSTAGSLRGVSPFQVAAAVTGRGAPRLIWDPPKPPNPFRLRFSPIALLLLLAFWGATGYYFFVRFKYTLDMGPNLWWGIVVIVAEIFGVTAVAPYGFLLWLHTQSHRTRGLPLDDGRVVLPPDKRFNVHILIPCYKEPLSVIASTVGAALSAAVPPGVTRTVYLCDDGEDPKKAAFVATLGAAARYVSGRIREPGEINGKSANINNCLCNVIYPDTHYQPYQIPWSELVVVFDADMQAKRNFLLKILEAMWDEDTALCLTPQAFSNINPKADIFNNINTQFWEYVLPGCDAWGYVACTGTNFCIRARALSAVSWFPEYTITEDYALSMELKAAGFKGRYLPEYLAVGEAPDEIRNVCRQRSRWTKGHMQIFFSSRCPLINSGLPPIHRWLYTNGTWSYFCTIITTIVFLMVPFMSLVLGIQPITFSLEFALAATVYLPVNFMLMHYARKPSHLVAQWMAGISNHILCFTYIKAVVNTLLSRIGVKEKAGFKATNKQGASPQAAAAAMPSGGSRGPNGAGGPMAPPLAAVHLKQQQQQEKQKQAQQQQQQRGPGGGRPPLAPCGGGSGYGAAHAHVGGRGRASPQPQQQQRSVQRGCWLWINAKTLEGALDPLALLISLCISLAAVGAGVYSIIKSKVFEIRVKSWDDFGRLFTEGRLDVYTLVPMFWAMHNAIPPVLFFVYFFTKGRLLRWSCGALQAVGLLLAAAAVAALWVVVPNRYDFTSVLPAVSGFLDAQKAGVLVSSMPRTSQEAYRWLETPAAADDPVPGGYFVNGWDYVKYSSPQAFTVSMLAWQLIAFSGGFEAAGQTDNVKGHLRHGADYLMACHVKEMEFVAQVGNPVDYLVNWDTGNGSWGWPSDMPKNRTAITITPKSRGGADLVASAAAALAATSVAEGPSSKYGARALGHAERLYKMALGMKPKPGANGSYCAQVPCYEGLKKGGFKWRAYPGDSVMDDMAWAGAWLFRATGQRSYLSDAEFYLERHTREELNATSPGSYVHNYNNVGWATQLLLAEVLDSDDYRLRLSQFLRGWMTGKNEHGDVLLMTPRGLAYLPIDSAGGSREALPNAAGAAFLSLLYANHAGKKQLGALIKNKLDCFALGQVSYMLGGQVGRNRGYIVGVGSRYPRAPQHREASCWPDRKEEPCTALSALLPPDRNPSVILGALVGGPDQSDSYVDSRLALGARVGVHYNAVLLGAMAGLLQRQVQPSRCQGAKGFVQEMMADQFVGA